MSSVRGVDSWQDAYIFCLQPNFQDDLWLFMIFAAIQVSLAGLKLTSFFINRWARGSKVGSGDDDEDNVGDDGASGGISIMGVLTLIAGALILAAYCDNEPDETTFNIFKAGVYLNTFLFAVALIFICGLVAAFVIDILTRRRGRSITFRMFLGGTIVLSIAASFFGATGIMGLKYIQSECYEEVELYFKDSEEYLNQNMYYADEMLSGSHDKPTRDEIYREHFTNLIGEPTIFTETENTDRPFYVQSTVYKEYATRQEILDLPVRTANYVIVNDKIIRLNIDETKARCFDTAGFVEVDGLLSCPIKFSSPSEDYLKYDEASEKIVGRQQCSYDEQDLICDENSASFPLCCEQFSNDYTKTEGCWCINKHNDASCNFDKDIDCSYVPNTLDPENQDQRDYYCKNSNEDWCEKVDNKYTWDKKCDDKATDAEKYACCKQVFATKDHIRTWYEFGNKRDVTMIPSVCNKYYECTTSQEIFEGCCDRTTAMPGHTDCDFCKKTAIVDKDDEDDHADTCGYDNCYDYDIQKKTECCLEAQTKFSFTFKEDSICEKAINYNPCDDNDDSLACSTVTSTECHSGKDCFPKCCKDLKFDFATTKTIEDSINSDCFQLASELIISDHDTHNQLGQFIYKYTGQKDGRKSCSHVNGIIDPKCCNKDHEYGSDDPCFCHQTNKIGDSRCTKVHHKDCHPSNDDGAYPQCCYDIGDFFSIDHFCSCKLHRDPKISEPENDCNAVKVDNPKFEFISTCPNPCSDSTKALIPDKFICEVPIFTL